MCSDRAVNPRSGSRITDVGARLPNASITGVPSVRTMAEPCMSSHGEFEIMPSSRSALRAAHRAAIKPPVE